MSDHRKKPGSPGDILIHHGVKGQKWGVRKEEVGSGRAKEQKKARAKKVAIGVGALLVASGAAVVAYQLHKNGKLSISSRKKTSKLGSSAVKKILSEPTYSRKPALDQLAKDHATVDQILKDIAAPFTP